MACEQKLVGGIEGGGTYFRLALGEGQNILARAEIRTGHQPEALLAEAAGWFLQQEKSLGKIAALGVACFGPTDVNPGTATFGRIKKTPKPGWTNADVLGPLRVAFPGLPLAYETDVNGSLFGEYCFGAGRGLTDFVYQTIGTGVGAGAMVGGKILHGSAHPEVGHMTLRRQDGDTFPGVCPFHGACLEGLVSGPALLKRTGIPAEDLPADHPAWQQLARYVGQGLTGLIYVLSPQVIILGGSVSKGGKWGEGFLMAVRAAVAEELSGYIEAPPIVAPGLHENSGLLGAMALGHAALEAASGGQSG